MITLHGRLNVGNTLTVGIDDLIGACSYHWYRNGEVIVGENSENYTLQKQDRGARMRVSVTLHPSGETMRSSESMPVKRRYNCTEAKTTKRENLKRKSEGLPPIDRRKTTRKYEKSGKYVGYKGKIRTDWKSEKMRRIYDLNRCKSPYMNTDGTPKIREKRGRGRPPKTFFLSDR